MAEPSSGRSTYIVARPLEARSASVSIERLHREALFRYVSYALLLSGAALRLTQYLANRSLSIDESFLALNLIQKAPRDLLGELNFNQAAPLGFLEVEKLAIALFGQSEYALRLPSLLVSLLALVAFYWVARKFLDGVAIPVAVAVFALLEPLIFYSASGKQYAFDAAIAVLIFGIGLVVHATRLDVRALMMLTAVGLVALWFSHASVFVLASLGLLLAYQALRAGDRIRVLQLLPCFAICGLSLGIELALSRSNIAHIQGSFTRPRSVFLGGVVSDGSTWFDSATARLRYFAGLEETASGRGLFGPHHVALNQALTLLVLAIAAIGFLSLVVRRTEKALLLIVPGVLVLVASALDQYPLVGRTLLFLLVPLALAFGEGARIAISAFRFPSASLAGGAIVFAALAAIAILPALHLFAPRRSEELKPVLDYLGSHRRSGDALYVAHNAQYAAAYYHLCGCAGFDLARAWPFATGGGSKQTSAAMHSRSRNLIVGSTGIARGEYRQDLQRFLGRPRVWILVADLPSSQVDPLLEYVDGVGHGLDSFSDGGPNGIRASVYLYDLQT